MKTEAREKIAEAGRREVNTRVPQTAGLDQQAESVRLGQKDKLRARMGTATAKHTFIPLQQ